jgi:crotonobetainyl-CoA:carnitine CoA-transferase CaiB-like acyl-CoA transferase
VSQSNRSGPLAGIRIIEFGLLIAGPIAGQTLADMGAEVIKIEPIEGDPLRQMQPIHNGMAAMFLQTNRHKKSLALDLKSEAGRKAARELIKSADVLLHNMRPGVLERLGLGYDEVREDNPGLIYAGISGFGTSGPDVDRPAFDHVIQGVAAMMFPSVVHEGAEPSPIRNAIVDKVAGLTMANSINAALFHRERNGGEGQKISISLLDAAATFSLADKMFNDSFQSPDRHQVPSIELYHPLKTKDGYVIGLLQLDKQFVGACKIFNRPDLIEDERFNRPWPRMLNIDAMWVEFGKSAADMTTAAIIDGARQHSVPLGPINTIPQFFEDPQVKHNGTYFDMDDPELGTLRQLKHPADFEKSPVDVRARAPLLGEHSREILRSVGVDDAEFDRMQRQGVVG